MSIAGTNAITELWAKCKAYFQAKLVSGTNIKTINNESLLGSGNISVGGGSSAVTGVKGNSESTYRTGNVNLTAANVGAAASSHTHAAGDVTSGTFADARIPSLAISKITNLQTTLNGKQAAGDYWSASKGDTSYWGLVNPDGAATGWARTPGSGLLPAASGGGSSSLGTSTWPFTNLHAQNIYHNGTKLGTAATHNHGDYVASTDSRVGSIESTNTEIRITSLNGLLRLTLTSGNNLRVDTRASTSDEWTNGLYYPGVAPVNETTIANVITQTSTQSTNNPISAAKYYKVNSVSMVEITFKPAAARSAGAAISLGTIVSGKRPHLQAFGGSDRIMGSITSAGVCNLYVRTALTANTAYTIGFTYTT